MKKNIFAFLTFLFLTPSYSQEVKKEEPIRLKGVDVDNDYHNNISWIKSKPIALVSKDFTVSPYSVTYIQIYFGMYVREGKQYMTPIRLVNKYRDSDWIFFDEVSYLLGSRKDVKYGKSIVFKVQDDETKTDVNKGISEESDIVANENAIAFIKYVLNNETGLNIRYTNKRDRKYVEIDVPDGTKKLQKHFKTLIDYYNLLNEKYKMNQPF
jgi:hypothetical protein